MPDYSKSSIYKLCCKDPSIKEIYIGSTTNFRNRKNQHKTGCNNPNGKKYNYNVYKYIRDNCGFNNFDMILVEEFKCENKKQLEQRERYWIEELQSTLNTYVPTQTSKEHRVKNRENILEQKKVYREKNIEKIRERDRILYPRYKEQRKEYMKGYREANKELLKEKGKVKIECCICGSVVRKSDIRSHQKTIKCLNFTKQ